MNKIKAFLSSQKSYAIIFWVMILIRGIFNYEIPLTDNTEARYAEIARIMSETQNWITLQIDYGIPFWAKPPHRHGLVHLVFQSLEIMNSLFGYPF
tara:strand:+ start:124 stop:411 length:288 start_codon:yes stop_codon:yes gene_type:complete